MTPHPLRSYQNALRLDHPIGNSVQAAYIVCTSPLYANMASSRARALALGWRFFELRCGHDAMILLPDETAETLVRIGTDG